MGLRQALRGGARRAPAPNRPRVGGGGSHGGGDAAARPPARPPPRDPGPSEREIHLSRRGGVRAARPPLVLPLPAGRRAPVRAASLAPAAARGSLRLRSPPPTGPQGPLYARPERVGPGGGAPKVDPAPPVPPGPGDPTARSRPPDAGPGARSGDRRSDTTGPSLCGHLSRRPLKRRTRRATDFEPEPKRVITTESSRPLVHGAGRPTPPVAPVSASGARVHVRGPVAPTAARRRHWGRGARRRPRATGPPNRGRGR